MNTRSCICSCPCMIPAWVYFSSAIVSSCCDTSAAHVFLVFFSHRAAPLTRLCRREDVRVYFLRLFSTYYFVNHSQAHRLADLPFWSHSPPSINNPAHRENRDKTIHHRSYLSFLLLFMFAQCSLSISSTLIILIKEAHASIEFPLHTKTTRREECSREGTTFH